MVYNNQHLPSNNCLIANEIHHHL